MTAATLIRDDDRSSTHILRDARALLATHGHDNGWPVEGKVPLRVGEALRLAMGLDSGARIMLFSPTDRIMYNNAWSRLEVGLAAMGNGLSLARWLIHATTTQVTDLIDFVIKDWERP